MRPRIPNRASRRIPRRPRIPNRRSQRMTGSPTFIFPKRIRRSSPEAAVDRASNPKAVVASSLKVAAARVAVTRVVREIPTFTCRQSKTSELKARFPEADCGRMAYVPRTVPLGVKRILSQPIFRILVWRRMAYVPRMPMIMGK